MIVDDELSTLKLYEHILERCGYEVIGKAKNGDEAVKIYNSFSNKPDLVIMDYRIPIKNGIEVTKEILKINKQARIIFVSADISVKEKVFSVGALSFKEKPIKSIEFLISNIENALKTHIMN